MAPLQAAANIDSQWKQEWYSDFRKSRSGKERRNSNNVSLKD